MAVVSSDVDICNLAMDYLNQTPINSLSSPVTKTEQLLSRWYDNIRRSCLRSHTWNFAIKTVNLSPLVAVPDLDWTHQYELPADYIRLIRIGDKFVPKRCYDIQNGRLYINSEGPLAFRYVFDNNVESAYDPLFVEFLALEIAISIGFQITGNMQKIEQLKALRDQRLQKAREVDGQERPPTRRERSRFKRARMFGRGLRVDLEGNEDW